MINLQRIIRYITYFSLRLVLLILLYPHRINWTKEVFVAELHYHITIFRHINMNPFYNRFLNMYFCCKQYNCLHEIYSYWNLIYEIKPKYIINGFCHLPSNNIRNFMLGQEETREQLMAHLKMFIDILTYVWNMELCKYTLFSDL